MGYAVPVKFSLTSPAGATTLVGSEAVGGIIKGLDSLPILTLTAALIGHAGGTLDVFLQTRDIGAHWVGGSGWRDIFHATQLAADGLAVNYRLAFQRGANMTAVPQLVNTVSDTPTLAANTVLAWANGSEVRIVLVSGAGSAGGAVISFEGEASEAL